MENIESQNVTQNITQNPTTNPSLNQSEVSQIPDNTKPAEKHPLFKVVIAWCALGLGFVFTHFAFSYMCGIWGGIFWLVFGVLGAVYAVKSGVKITKMQVAMFAIAEIFCFTPLFCASRFINFLAAVFSFVLYFYLAMVVSGAEPFGKRFLPDLFLSVLVRPFERFGDCFRSAFSVFKGKRAAKNVLYAVVGLIIAVPLTIVVVMLLASSDARFEEFIDSAAKYLPDFSFTTILEIAFGIPIAMYLFGSFSSVEKRVSAGEFDPDKLRVLPTMITYFAVTPICIFYVAYIITQALNIASALDQTLNYSEFARRGFFELCAIAVINLGVIAVMQTFAKSTRVIKCYIGALSVLSLGVIATALVKMGMYIGEYGMTLLRVYTTWFMAVMCIAFILLIVLQIKDFKFWRVLFFGFTAMFFALCFFDVDGMIAKYNVSAYKSGKIEDLDISEFSELGYSAVVSAEKLYNDGNDSYALKRYLSNVNFGNSHEDKFAFFSIPRAKADAALKRIPSDYFIYNYED